MNQEKKKTNKRLLIIIIVIALMLASVGITSAVHNKKLTEIEREYASQLEQVRAEAEAAQTQLQLIEEEQLERSEMLVDLITRVDYKNEPVYVIGHKSPDSDTVGAAVGMAHLLNSLGVAAEARITADVNLETDYAFSTLGYTAPDILEDAAGKQLWLVDHSATTQMINGAEKARIVGITDHHGIGDAETSEPICVLSCPAGSTCAVVYTLCEACDVDLPEDTAGILLTGLLSDTSNMKSNAVTKLDEAAFEDLKMLSGITNTDELFNGMLEATLSYQGMSDTEIFYSDYKNYKHNETKYGIGCIKVANPDLVPAMAERMQTVIRSEIDSGCEADFLLYSIYDPDYSTGCMGIAGKDAAFAEKLMAEAFGEKAEKQDGFFVFKPSLSRKKEVVPQIDTYLDTLS